VILKVGAKFWKACLVPISSASKPIPIAGILFQHVLESSDMKLAMVELTLLHLIHREVSATGSFEVSVLYSQGSQTIEVGIDVQGRIVGIVHCAVGIDFARVSSDL
jgi:hypothetical protein